MKEKVKEFVRSTELKVAAAAPVACAAVMGVASAAEGSSSSATLVSAFTTGFQQIVTDATGMIAAAAPIALGLAGTIFLARKAISWFKGMAK